MTSAEATAAATALVRLHTVRAERHAWQRLGSQVALIHACWNRSGGGGALLFFLFFP